jgi:hypothetical protein
MLAMKRYYSNAAVPDRCVHTCESSLVSGEVVYGPEPLDQATCGNVLVCCARAVRDVFIDL